MVACTKEDKSKKEAKDDPKQQVGISDESKGKNDEQPKEVSNELGDEPSQWEKDLIEIAPEIPTNLEEILAYPVGPLAGNGVQSTKSPKMTIEELAAYVKETLPPVDDAADEAFMEDWSKAYHYLFAEDYPDPNEIISKTKFEHFGNPGIEDERFQLKDQLNVLVILDVSGSMANTINGKPMMDIAKDAIRDFTTDLPKEANVGLRVYGHEGKRTGKTKEESCQISELVYDIQPMNTSEFQKVLEPFKPTGWTPIGLSLQEAKQDFADFPGNENTNLIYVVSDGAETCGGDPVAAAEELAASDIQSIVNVIGFNVDIDGQSHLRDIADAGGGVYTNAGDETQLQEALEQAERIAEMWMEWKKGVAREAVGSRKEQRIKTSKLYSDWILLKNDELLNKQLVASNLREQGYITRKLDHILSEKNESQSNLYGNLQEDIYNNLVKEIEENYNELLDKMEESYQGNMDDRNGP